MRLLSVEIRWSESIYSWGELFEQGDFALALNGGERVVQFVRSIADERFFRLESGVDSVQHPVQRADEVVQFILVAERFHPYVQVVSTDALQLFEHVFQGMQNAVGIDSSDEIDESATHQQQEQGEQEDVFLNVASVIIACHDQYDEVAFIVGIVEGGTPQIAVDERNRKVFEQACLLVAVEIFVQRVVHGCRRTVCIQQYLLCLWQQFVIFLLDFAVAVFIHLIFFPMLLSGQIGFFYQVRVVKMVDVAGGEKVEYHDHRSDCPYGDDGIKQRYSGTYLHTLCFFFLSVTGYP